VPGARRKGLARVHAIVGDGRSGFDSQRAEEALSSILGEFLGASGSEVERLRGDETTWARVLDSARTPSLFSPRRAIVVRGAEALKGDAEGLSGYLDDPNPDVVVVLVAVKPDGRRVAWKTVLAKANVVKAEPLKGKALRAYVGRELQRRKLPLTEEALDELIEHVGQDLRRLLGEVDKLEAFWDGKGPLSAETVAAVSGRGLAPPLYRLGDALLARRKAEVLALTEEVLGEGESGPLVLGALYRALRQVRGVQALGGTRASRQDLASRLRIPPFKIDDVLAAARRWPEGDLRRAVQAFGRADRQMKLGRDPRVVLCAAVVESCGLR
jgi:DNA polymerase III subunit delta